MGSYAVVIVKFPVLIIINMLIKRNAPSAVMFMAQMVQICTKENAPSVKVVLWESSIGKHYLKIMF